MITSMKDEDLSINNSNSSGIRRINNTIRVPNYNKGNLLEIGSESGSGQIFS